MTPRPLVLVIDDEAVVCAAVERVLGEAGYEVAVAATGGDGLAHPAAARCDVALCDLVLPDRSGVDVVGELHRRRPDLPIVVTTGYAATGTLSQISEAGAVSYLAKPFDGGELLDAVRRALAGAAAGPAEKETS